MILVPRPRQVLTPAQAAALDALCPPRERRHPRHALLFALQQGQLGRSKKGAAVGGGGASSVTWNPSDKTAGITLSGGNLTAGETGTAQDNVRATAGIADGELRYFEILLNTVSGGGTAAVSFGLRASGDAISSTINVGNTCSMRQNGSFFVAGTGFASTGTAVAYLPGDVIGFAINRSTQRVYVHKNGTYVNSGDPAGGTGYAFTLPSGGSLMPYAWVDNTTATTNWTLRASSSSWGYAAPSGYSQMP